MWWLYEEFLEKKSLLIRYFFDKIWCGDGSFFLSNIRIYGGKIIKKIPFKTERGKKIACNHCSCIAFSNKYFIQSLRPQKHNGINMLVYSFQ